MPYTPYHADWKDYPDTTTPITAAALEYVETGIQTAQAAAEAGVPGPQGPQGNAGTSANMAVATKTSNYTLDAATDAVILADASAASFNLTLPTAVGNTGKVFHMRRVDNAYGPYVVGIVGTVDGATLPAMTSALDWQTVISNGTSWRRVDGFHADATSIYVDGKNGLDTNTGYSRHDPLQTIVAAITKASNGTLITVLDLAPTPSTAQPDITINKAVRLVFETNPFTVGSMALSPATPSSVMIDVTVTGVVIENLCIRVPATFTGTGLKVTSSNGFQLKGYSYTGVEDATYNEFFGGTALHPILGERMWFDDVVITNSTKAIHKTGTEGSVGMFNKLNTFQNYRDCVWEGGGGFVFVEWKATNSGSPVTEVTVIDFQAGSAFTFVNPDWCESAPNNIAFAGTDSTFIRPVSSPGSTWNITGDRNTFVQAAMLGDSWVVDGDDNTIAGARFLGTISGAGLRNRLTGVISAAVNVSGSNWVYDNCSITTETSYGVRPRFVKATGAGTAVPTTGTWVRGDIVWNTTPSSGGPPGWMCTAAGTPGTWKAMANLA